MRRARLMAGVSLPALHRALPKLTRDDARRIGVRVAIMLGSAPPPVWHPDWRYLNRAQDMKAEADT